VLGPGLLVSLCGLFLLLVVGVVEVLSRQPQHLARNCKQSRTAGSACAEFFGTPPAGRHQCAYSQRGTICTGSGKDAGRTSRWLQAHGVCAPQMPGTGSGACLDPAPPKSAAPETDRRQEQVKLRERNLPGWCHLPSGQSGSAAHSCLPILTPDNLDGLNYQLTWVLKDNCGARASCAAEQTREGVNFFYSIRAAADNNDPKWAQRE